VKRRSGDSKKKILFIVEAATWSQVVRLSIFARGLDPRRYEVHFASARFDERLLSGHEFHALAYHIAVP